MVDGVCELTGGYLPLVSTLNAARVGDVAARLLGTDLAELADFARSATDTVGPVLVLDAEEATARGACVQAAATPAAPTSRGSSISPRPGSPGCAGGFRHAARIAGPSTVRGSACSSKGSQQARSNEREAT